MDNYELVQFVTVVELESIIQHVVNSFTQHDYKQHVECQIRSNMCVPFGGITGIWFIRDAYRLGGGGGSVLWFLL